MEQKYLVRIKSDVREAEFDVTGENGVCTSVRLKSLRYLKINPNSGHGEVMDAHIYENDDNPMNSNMLYKWIVLWGSIPEVIKEVETNLPVVMLETNVVWDGFEEDEGKSEICYTYPFSHAWGGKYAKYAISKVLFSGQGEMVAKMFNKNLEDVRVLVPEFC